MIDSRERDAKVYKVYSTKKGDKIKINLLSIANDNLLLFIKYKDENRQNHSYREDVVGTKFLSLNGITIFSILDKNPQKYKKYAPALANPNLRLYNQIHE